MKHFIIAISSLFLFTLLGAQSVAIRTQTPDNSSILELSSISKGILVPIQYSLE